MYIKRTIEEKIMDLSNQFLVVVVTGPRQVGKSTVLNHLKNSKMQYANLDDFETRSLAINDPKYFLEHYHYPLLIDEIQYAPNLLPYIKMIVDKIKYDNLINDTKSEVLFWLTGSEQFSLMKNVSESLAGRIGVLNLYSLSLRESLNESNQLDLSLFSPKLEVLKKKQGIKLSTDEIFEKIFYGGMPSVVLNKDKKDDFFSSYVNTYIERDIKQLSNISKHLDFYNFMIYIAGRTAQELHYSVIANEIGVDSKTIKSWISILEASGIIYLLQPYYANVSSRIIKAPKLYFMDTGLCSYLAKYQDSKTLEVGALSGAIFETFVVSEIIKNFTSHGIDPRRHLYYYRDKDQKEIDLIYQEADTIYPIEIKKAISPNNSQKNFSVLNKYKKNIKEGIVICMTDTLHPINKDCWLCPVTYI